MEWALCRHRTQKAQEASTYVEALWTCLCSAMVYVFEQNTKLYGEVEGGHTRLALTKQQQLHNLAFPLSLPLPPEWIVNFSTDPPCLFLFCQTPFTLFRRFVWWRGHDECERIIDWSPRWHVVRREYMREGTTTRGCTAWATTPTASTVTTATAAHVTRSTRRGDWVRQSLKLNRVEVEGVWSLRSAIARVW